MDTFRVVTSLPQTSVLLASNGAVYGPVYEVNRLCIPLNRISGSVIEALLAVEDRRFFSHRGIDLRAIGRAACVNLRTFRLVQGGSTLTQQLARTAVLRRTDRTLRRKLVEALVAVALERTFTKMQILQAYLNAAYFGHNVYGIELAALTHCGKTAETLNDVNAAYLVGLLKAPARYCRCCDSMRAVARTRLVMRLSGMDSTSEKEYPACGTWKPRRSWADRLRSTGGYASQFARRWLVQNLSKYYPAHRLIVKTTIDSHCQLALELVCRIVRRTGYSGRLACVVQDAQSGEVKALTGGVEFRRQEFNSATSGCLQPGSLLKPFILLAALQKGIPLEYKYESRPLTIQPKYGKPWAVRNAQNHYRGWITIADALVFSDNTVYAQLLLDIGVESVARLLRAVGILAGTGTLALSTGAIRQGVSPLQICTSYSIFSSLGTFWPSAIVNSAETEEHKTVWHNTTQGLQVCSSSMASSIASLLRRVNDEGTGVLSTLPRGLAAKTGTSVSGGWHVSFDDVYRVLTWTESDFLPVGIDQYSGKAVSAKELAGRIWRLLRRSKLGFSELFSVLAGVDSMSVRELLWVENEFQRP